MELQNKIEKVYNDVFGYTPQSERLDDLQKQFFKLMRNTGVKNLKEYLTIMVSDTYFPLIYHYHHHQL